MRQIVLDTETTGLEPDQGHRIIEVGGVELVDRRLTGNDFHEYFRPDRPIDAGAVEVHGITEEFLADKPRFAEVAPRLLSYLEGAELIIHNAPFDVGFLNAELARLDAPRVRTEDLCMVTDTLIMARRKHPGQRNSLDALCKRYAVDNSSRDLHGALLDAQILARVYLAMTGGQASLGLDQAQGGGGTMNAEAPRRLGRDRPRLSVVAASAKELNAHSAALGRIQDASGRCLWAE